MKNPYILTILLVLISINNLKAQYLWPIADKDFGEDILYKPQDIVGDEFNYSNLFIKGDNESIVVAPESGMIKSYGYVYYESLQYSRLISVNYSGIANEVTFDNEVKTDFANILEIDKDLLSILVIVETPTKEKYYIHGLKPINFLHAGIAIKKGDTLGKMARSYYKIDELSICYSMTKGGKPSDPMSVFNLKSTFKKSTDKQSIDYLTYKHSPETLRSDFEIFKNALNEGHSGLLDYVSEKELNDKFHEIESELDKPMSSEQFRKKLDEIIYLIKDSHTAIYPVKYQPNKHINLPLLFGLNNDSVEVYSSTNNYDQFLGKKIIKIGNFKIDDIIDSVTNMNINHEGYIQSIKQRKLLMDFWNLYCKKFKEYDSDTLQFIFADKTSCNVVFGSYEDSLFHPKIKQALNSSSKIEIRDVEEKVGYIKITNFSLDFSEREYIKNYLKKAVDSLYIGLIIDVRDNLGGNDFVVNEIYSYFANAPWQQPLFCKVNKISELNLLKNCTNLSPYVNYFKDYKENEYGFSYNGTNYKPDDSVNFKGKLVVFMNEYSKSAATLFPALIYKYQRGILIGRETGSCYHQMNAVLCPKIQLENSGLELFMPLVKVVFDTTTNNKIPYGRGVLPDVEIALNYKEFVDENSSYFEKALEVINNENSKGIKHSRLSVLLLLILITAIILGIYLRNRKYK